jgi:hypothetical protein
MSFGQSADCGVTGHLSYGIGVLGKKKGSRSQTRRSMSRFYAGMTGTNNQDIKMIRIGKHKGCSTWNNL